MEGDEIDDSRRSNRKRERERQRRNDIASAFEQLSSLVSQIQPEDEESSQNRRRRRKSSSEGNDTDAIDSTGMTRLDIICRTIEAIRKLQGEVTRLRGIVDQRQRGSSDYQTQEVLVMVPTLTEVGPDRRQYPNFPDNRVFRPYYHVQGDCQGAGHHGYARAGAHNQHPVAYQYAEGWDANPAPSYARLPMSSPSDERRRIHSAEAVRQEYYERGDSSPARGNSQLPLQPDSEVDPCSPKSKF